MQSFDMSYQRLTAVPPSLCSILSAHSTSSSSNNSADVLRRRAGLFSAHMRSESVPLHSQVILRRQVLPGLLKSQAAQSSSVTMADGCSLQAHSQVPINSTIALLHLELYSRIMEVG